VVFESGILYQPDAVERYGKIYVEVQYATGGDTRAHI